MSDNLTERQKKWFASVKAGLERDTGKTLDQWVAIARTCPETRHKARVDWLREKHGLGVNRAARVLDAAFPSEAGWDDPAAQRAQLWKNESSAVLLQALEAAIAGIDGVVPTQRKGFTAWSRKVQFAAARPFKDGQLVLGLAIEPQGIRLQPPRNEGWSDRLKSKLVLAAVSDIDRDVVAWLKQAADRS